MVNLLNFSIIVAVFLALGMSIWEIWKQFRNNHASLVYSSSSSESALASLSGRWSCRKWATNLTCPYMVISSLFFVFSCFFLSSKIASLRSVPKVLLKNFLTGIFSWFSEFSINSSSPLNMFSLAHDSSLSSNSPWALCFYLIFLTKNCISFLNSLCPDVESFLSAGSNLILTIAGFLWHFSMSINIALHSSSHFLSLCS